MPSIVNRDNSLLQRPNNYLTGSKSPELLGDCSLLGALNIDPRPTIVVDTSDVQNVDIIYMNPALEDNKDLFACLRNACNRDASFLSWLGSTTSQEQTRRHGGILWSAFCIDDRRRLVSTSSPQKTQSGINSDHMGTSVRSTPNGTDQSIAVPEARHTDYHATTTRLREEIRNLEFAKKLAEHERAACQSSAEKLLEQLEQQAELLTSQLPKATSRPTSNVLEHGSSAQPGFQRSVSSPTTSDFCSDPPSSSIDGRISPITPSSISKPAIDHDTAIALQKYQKLAEMGDVGFFNYHPSGKLVHANESWYTLSGHPRDPKDHTNLSFQQCVYPDDMELVMRNWDLLLQGHPVTFEMRWKKPSKTSDDPIQASDAQWVLSACVPVIGDDGQVKSISGCTTDINLQKYSAEVALQRAEALERARTSEERFARFASVAPIAIFRFDKHGNVEYCNDRWFELTGIAKMPFEEIQYPFGVLDEDIPACTQAWDASIEDRSIGTVEFRLRKEWHDVHGRRGPTWVHATFFPEYSDDGTYLGLMGSLSNVSHLKWAENVQKMRAEEALEAKRQQENFIDITSHEMRNPLSAMVQCADSILSSMNELSALCTQQPINGWTEWEDRIETASDAAQTILSCAAHQKRIVDDILTLSKLDSNLLLITPIKTQPIQMVQDVVKMFEMDSKKADLAIDIDVDESFKSLSVEWLTLDPSRVIQILINLLTNAIKFTRDESERIITVRLSVHTQPPSKSPSDIDYVPAETMVASYGSGGDWGEGDSIFLKIEVQDTGRGLNPEEKAKLFLRFSQASPKTHVQYGGSGLGLFISRRLTEMQGGEIGFTSEPEVGSTFAFYIKARQTTAPAQQEGSFATRVNSRNGTGSSTPQGREKAKIHVLLVEDNVVNQKVLKQQLLKVGCQVYLAGQGVEALAFLRTTKLWHEPEGNAEPLPLDVILMDIEMPVMGGLECTREIRKLEKSHRLRKHLPIISISANARQEQVNEARAAGCDDTITKPFRIVELMPKIETLVPS